MTDMTQSILDVFAAHNIEPLPDDIRIEDDQIYLTFAGAVDIGQALYTPLVEAGIITRIPMEASADRPAALGRTTDQTPYGEVTRTVLRIARF